jgi:hypothetical protein
METIGTLYYLSRLVYGLPTFNSGDFSKSPEFPTKKKKGITQTPTSKWRGLNYRTYRITSLDKLCHEYYLMFLVAACMLQFRHLQNLLIVVHLHARNHHQNQQMQHMALHNRSLQTGKGDQVTSDRCGDEAGYCGWLVKWLLWVAAGGSVEELVSRFQEG